MKRESIIKSNQIRELRKCGAGGTAIFTYSGEAWVRVCRPHDQITWP